MDIIFRGLKIYWNIEIFDNNLKYLFYQLSNLNAILLFIKFVNDYCNQLDLRNPSEDRSKSVST